MRRGSPVTSDLCIMQTRCWSATRTATAPAALTSRRLAVPLLHQKARCHASAPASGEPAMTVAEVQDILKKVDSSPTGLSQPPQPVPPPNPPSEERVRNSRMLLRPGQSNLGLEYKILELLPKTRPSVVVPDARLLVPVFVAINAANAMLKKQGKDEVICVRPSVRRTTMGTLMANGISEEVTLALNLSTVPERAAGGMDIRVKKDTRVPQLTGFIRSGLAEKGEVTVKAVGGFAVETSLKALLSARMQLIQEESDVEIVTNIEALEVAAVDNGRVLGVHVFHAKRVALPAMEPRSEQDGLKRRPYTPRSQPDQSVRKAPEEGSVTISAEKWKAINDQIEALTKLNGQLAELVKRQQQQS